MKEFVTWARQAWQDETILSSFFSARVSQELERSPLDLHRSLTYHIVGVHDAWSLPTVHLADVKYATEQL